MSRPFPSPLLLLALGAPQLAWAATPTVAVVGVHQAGVDAGQQAQAAQKIARAIDKQGFDGLEPAEVSERVRGREDIILQESFLGRGKRQLDDGQALYHQAEFRAAVPVLEDAIDTLRHGIATANSGKALWEAWTLLGTVHLMQEDEAGARRAYAQAVAINPARTPSAADYPPNVSALYGAVRDARLQLTSTLWVAADAPDVTIFLNGVEKGAAPLEISGVVPGENHVVAKGPGGSHAYARVAVPESGEERLSIAMGEPSMGAAAESRLARSRQTANLYRSFGGHGEFDLVLLAGVSEDSLYLQLYSPRAEAFSSPVEASYAGTATDEVLAKLPALLEKVREDGTFFASQIGTQAVPLDVGANPLLARMLLSPTPAEALPPPGRSGPRLWTVAAVGVGAAALATGAVIALTAEKQPVFQGTIVVELP